ncbi:MAG: thiamine pyrophosphate-dependent dehydrogenase E1 component subunit alpha [Myxococcota bacterium]|nr:thiamine pyrophosphate-dependent dehydrogenase E1 component subunit alpha [Myxococcota bacterium]
MKRYSAYEFPEYIDWTPDDEAQREFRQLVAAGPRAAVIADITTEKLLDLYRGLVAARLHDIQLKRWVKQGVITKAWLGSGEEAVTVGTCAALDVGDAVGPMIRNAAALIERGVPLLDCFSSYLGTTDNITNGRDLHIGDPSRGVIPPISHVGDLVPVMTGCALGFKLRGEKHVALTWTGDGSTATGAVHEGLKMAVALKAPLICVIQNNQVALGTRVDDGEVGNFSAYGDAYGAKLIEMNGNHILDVYAASLEAVAACRDESGPVIMVGRTFRMGGHATHDEREARELFDDELYAYWGKRDPVGMYETWLIEDRGLSKAQLTDIEDQTHAAIEAAARLAVSRRDSHAPDPATQRDGVYAE